MNKIDFYKEKHNKSYGSIAKECGLTSTYIYLLAKGERTNPSLDVMQRISAVFGEKVERVFQINES